MSAGLNQCCSNGTPPEELGFQRIQMHIYILFSPSPWLAPLGPKLQFDHLTSKYLGNNKSLLSLQERGPHKRPVGQGSADKNGRHVLLKALWP